VIHPVAEAQEQQAIIRDAAAAFAKQGASAGTGLAEPGKDEAPRELGAETRGDQERDEPIGELGTALPSPGEAAGNAGKGAPPQFFPWFWGTFGLAMVVLLIYYARMDAEGFIILKLLTESVMPLGILTIVVLAVILFGITTATESAAVGAAGAFLLAFQAGTMTLQRTKEAVFLTAKTTAMVCWLFVGSALFSAVFAHAGRAAAGGEVGPRAQPHPHPVHDPVPGDHLRARLAAGMDRDHRDLRADLPAAAEALPDRCRAVGDDRVREPAGRVPVAPGGDVGLLPQGGFAAPRHAEPDLRGMMPYMLIVILCMVIMYLWPGMTLWLPNYLYGGS
jgi:hypothetical protein